MITNPWQVQIQGWASDLEHLAHHFTSTPKRIIKDELEASFLYESDAFAACSQPDEILKLANEELSVISGVLKVTRNSPETLRTGAIYKRNANGRDIFICIQGMGIRAESGELRITVTDNNGNIVTVPTVPPRSVTITQLAAADIGVAKAMRLLAAPDYKTWVGMYRIHEVIEADLGGEHKLKKCSWGSAQDLKRFKRSANSVTVAGDTARHGKEIEQPPANPMSTDEAAAYLNYVLQSWLSSKGG